MAKLTWGFEISADPDSAVDENVKTGYSDGFVFSPNSFRARFVPRSQKHKDVIVREYAAARAIFAQYED